MQVENLFSSYYECLIIGLLSGNDNQNKQNRNYAEKNRHFIFRNYCLINFL